MDEDKPFTVRDRRKFTAEGERKSDAEDSPEPVEVPAPTPPAAGPPAEPHGDAEPRVDFASFLVSLATQASVLLSTPEGDEQENLRGARHLIDVLEMLEDKTRGRRTEPEEQVLQQILYELRMAFVERSRTVGA